MHWLDLILLLLLLISLIRGYSSGFVKQVIQLASVIGALLLATPFSSFLLDLLAKEGHTLTNSWIGWLLSFVTLLILFYLLSRFLLSGIEVALGFINRILGAALSFLITTTILSIMIGFYSNIGEQYDWTPVPENLKVYPVINEISRTILPKQLFIQQDYKDSFEIKKNERAI
ncbi:CvpA family protein [Porphyromonadaceae bacterium W3.11]|nr:CvpA family protein [Porphyromonadaceae bacterium W3.11]